MKRTTQTRPSGALTRYLSPLDPAELFSALASHMKPSID